MLGINMRETFENAAKVANNNVANNKKEEAKTSLNMSIAVVVVYLILMLLVGPFLWNNILRRLVPQVGKARWYDIVLLAILIGLVAP